MTEQKSKVLLLTALSIFGTVGIFVHYMNLPSTVIAVTRGFLGMFFLLFLLFVKKQKLSFSDIRKNIWFLSSSGALIGFNWITLFEAFRYTTVATAILCYYLAPIFMIVASTFLFKEHLSKIKMFCVAFALLGMVLVSGILQSSSYSPDNFKGVLFAVGAAVIYASVIILNKFIKNISAYDRTIVQLGMAAIVSLPYAIAMGDFKRAHFSFLSIVLLIILGLFHTGIGYSLYFSCVQRLKTQTVAIYSYMDPIVAVFLSSLLLGEKMSFLSMIGAVLILGSTFVSEFSERPKKR